jgi:hypothetical protein
MKERLNNTGEKDKIWWDWKAGIKFYKDNTKY